MKTKPKLLHSLIAAAVLVPVVASAELAVTTGGVNMRAGPDVSFPQVASLPPNVTVDVVGCVEGYVWCDVVAGPNRGWVSAAYLSSSYNNVPTVISYAGPSIGIPLVSFAIGPYWDSYYRGRPWWNNRTYWYNRYDNRYAGRPEWRGPQRYVQTPRYEAPRYENRDNRSPWRGNDNQWRGNNGNNGQWRGNNANNGEWRGNDGNNGNNGQWRGNNGNNGQARGNNERHAAAPGVIPGPYTRAEGGSRDVIQGHRPNDQAHPNAQQ